MTRLIKSVVPQEVIETKILLIRGKKVMLDRDLAELYRVQTKVFNQAVKRNMKRFPSDFMFEMTKEELKNWRSQIVTSNPSLKMGLRKRPYVFTENGVAMLSGVLNSERAIEVNIQIMRVFTRLREILATHQGLEKKFAEYDKQFKIVFDVLNRLLRRPRELSVEPKLKHRIGFEK
jgi:hypothetical protein